jgi:hypothetical protein
MKCNMQALVSLMDSSSVYWAPKKHSAKYTKKTNSIQYFLIEHLLCAGH